MCNVIRLLRCLILILRGALLLRTDLLHASLAFRRASGLRALEGAARLGCCWFRRSPPPEELTLFLRRVPAVARCGTEVLREALVLYSRGRSLG